MNLIVAADENWGIGQAGGLLTHLPGDMKYFRETTSGKAVIMGRKTLESFPGGRPLKNRTNLVLTANPDYKAEGAVICTSIDEILKAAAGFDPENLFVIGGGTIYRQFLPFCTKAYVTHIYRSFQADTDFPDLDQDPEWSLTSQSTREEYEGTAYDFRIYTRVKGGRKAIQ